MPNSDQQFQEWLNKLRKKLLDLTARNRLIHYRPSRKNSLQVINELPDHVFERLVVASKSFRFLPRDDDGPLLGQVEASSQDSLSLPSPDQVDVTQRHLTDDKLQTDRTHDVLDAVLKRIRTQARSSIEETGVNLLYLAIGFLEWYESDDSQESRFSPLILIPVRLDRELRRNQFEYSLSHTGEEIQTNVCLAKRLFDDFQFQLPEFEDGQSPEAYFDAVREAIHDRLRWTIRREAYLDFFSFRKLQMYVDLDPARWPSSRPLTSNKKLVTIWQGEQGGSDVRRFASDYHLDDNEQADRIVLADDADSSQHSALMDIASGRDLVIEGPPARASRRRSPTRSRMRCTKARRCFSSPKNLRRSPWLRKSSRAWGWAISVSSCTRTQRIPGQSTRTLPSGWMPTLRIPPRLSLSAAS